MQNPKWVCFSISSKQMGVADTVTETHGACSQSMVLCHKRYWGSPWLYTRSEIQVGRFFFVSPPRGGETKYTLKDNTNERCWYALEIDHFWANDFEFYELVFIKCNGIILGGFGWIMEVYYRSITSSGGYGLFLATRFNKE